jgi:hypothetical protein
MKLSFIPLLLGGKSISGEARQALRENRLQDAARLLMQQYGLSCVEAGHLLDVAACDQ